MRRRPTVGEHREGREHKLRTNLPDVAAECPQGARKEPTATSQADHPTVNKSLRNEPQPPSAFERVPLIDFRREPIEENQEVTGRRGGTVQHAFRDTFGILLAPLTALGVGCRQAERRISEARATGLSEARCPGANCPTDRNLLNKRPPTKMVPQHSVPEEAHSL